jgi:hypothetical protein
LATSGPVAKSIATAMRAKLLTIAAFVFEYIEKLIKKMPYKRLLLDFVHPNAIE